MDAIAYIKWWSITYFSTSGGPGPYTAAKLIGKYYTMQKQRPGTGNVSRMANSILDTRENILLQIGFYCQSKSQSYQIKSISSNWSIFVNINS